ncbi:MAG: LPD5 domain-containing protein [Verrucomicrobiota bacterium]
MQAITGEKVPKSKAGATAVRDALAKYFGIDAKRDNLALVQVERGILKGLRDLAGMKEVTDEERHLSYDLGRFFNLDNADGARSIAIKNLKTGAFTQKDADYLKSLLQNPNYKGDRLHIAPTLIAKIDAVMGAETPTTAPEEVSATYANGLPKPQKVAMEEAKRLGVVIEPYMHGVYEPEPAFKVFASSKPENEERTVGTTAKALISAIRIVAERAGHGESTDGGFKVKDAGDYRESERANMQQEVDDRMNRPKTSDPNALLFDKEYTGPRHTYGLRNRPLATGAQPKGWIIDSLREHPDFRHGTVQYPRELTKDELYSYEMEPVKEAEAPTTTPEYPPITPHGHEITETVKGKEWQITDTETGEIVKITPSIRDGFIANTEGTAQSTPGIGFKAALMWADNHFEDASKAAARNKPAPAETPAPAFPSLLEYAKSRLPKATADKITDEKQAESFRAQWEKERAAQSSKLQDFGEKLGGARKDKSASMQREYSDDDLASKSLSEIWPKSEVDAIEDIPLAALATAVRAEIPSKPRQGYKLKQWVEKVKLVRGVMKIADELGYEAVVQKFAENHVLKKLVNKISLLQEVPREQWGRIGDVNDYPDAYQYSRTDGKNIPSPFADAVVDGRRMQAPHINDLIPKVNEALGTKPPEKKMEFEVRGRTIGNNRGNWNINKKGDPLYRVLKSFPDTESKEALDYIRSNHADLVAAWEGVKERMNVKETDVRSETNRPRTGQDWRKGKDASPEMFSDTFGFRGVEFGNWVSQGANAKERQGMINAAFDALSDLANIVGIPQKAISLNGTLGLGFGSRGHGWASAHFEPGNLVINLTKTRGAGSLGHEWFHALDNYFQRKRNVSGLKNNEGDFITAQPETYYEGTEGRISGQRFTESRLKQWLGRDYDEKIKNWKKVEGVRPEVAAAFADVVKALNDSPMAKRAALIDKGKSGGYWSDIIERAARSFENYLIGKMQIEGYNNDYLANVVSIEDFAREADRYPYLLAEELAPVSKAFDDLFSTIETKETDKGIALAASSIEGSQGGKSLNDLIDSLGDLSSYKLTGEDEKHLSDFIGKQHGDFVQYVEGSVIPEMPEGSVGTRNAYTDWQRSLKDLPPRFKSAARGFGKVWDEAMAKINGDKDAGSRLIDGILHNPRAMTDVERALLTHEFLTRSNEFDAAVDAQGAAKTEIETIQANERLSLARDKYYHALEASAKAGTESGRSLNAIRIAIMEDYSLARLEAKARAAQDGVPLTKDQTEEINRLHAKIEETQAALDKAEEESAAKFTKEQVDKMIADVKAKTPVPESARRKPLANVFSRMKESALEAFKKQHGLSAPAITDASTARHSELEAKHRAGTITPAETAEAQKLADEAAKMAHPPRGLAEWMVKPEKLTFLKKTLKTKWGTRYYELTFKGDWYHVRIADHSNTSDNPEVRASSTIFNDLYAKNSGTGMDNAHDLNLVVSRPIETEEQAKGIILQTLRALGPLPREEITGEIFGVDTLDPINIDSTGNPDVADIFEARRKVGSLSDAETAIADRNEAIQAYARRIKYIDERIDAADGSGNPERIQKWADAKADALKERPFLPAPFTGVPLEQRSDPESNSILNAHAIAGSDPLVEIGAANYFDGAHTLQEWVEAMRKDGLGDYIGDDPQDLFAQSKAKHDEVLSTRTRKGKRKETPQGAMQDMRESAEEDGSIDASGIRALALAHIREGVDNAAELVKKVHADLLEVYPDITPREVQDAISGYGIVSHPSADPDKRMLSELKTQIRLISSIDDVLSGKPPQRTGFQRGEPSDVVRGLNTQLRDEIKAAGIEVTDPATQLKSAQDAIRTHLENRKADLERQIAARKRDERTQTKTEYDANMLAMKARVDELAKELDLISPRPGLTEAQKIKNAEKSAVRAIEALQNRIKNGEIALKKPNEIHSSNLDALREQRKALGVELKKLRDNAGITQEIALKQLKRRLEKSTEELRKKMAASDFSKKKKSTIERDPEADKLLADNIEARRAFHALERKMLLASRPKMLKAVSWLARYGRFNKISGLKVIGKLFTAANIRTITTPLEDAIGLGTSIIPGIKGIAQRSPRNFGASYGLGRGIKSSIIINADSFVKGWMGVFKNAGERWKTGKSPWEAIHEKENSSTEMYSNERDWMDYMGHLHMILKSPAAEIEYARSLRNRAIWAMEHGIDITQPLAAIRLSNAATRQALDAAMKGAYEDSQAAKLMQPNIMSDGFNGLLRTLETSQRWKDNGGKYGAQLLRILFPIVKIPSNFAVEAFRYTPAGFLFSLGEAAIAINKGLEKLPPEKADAIMKHLSKGLLGLGLLLLGFLFPDNVGGYYQEHEKRKTGEVGAGGFRIFGWDVPRWMSHTPALEAIQFGATMRRVMDHYMHKNAAKEGEDVSLRHGLEEGTLASLSGIIDDIPFISGIKNALKLGATGEEGTKARGEFLRDMTIPRGLTESTETTDRRDENGATINPLKGEPVKRDPKTITDTFKAAIPILRQQVEEKGGNYDEYGRLKADVPPKSPVAILAEKTGHVIPKISEESLYIDDGGGHHLPMRQETKLAFQLSVGEKWKEKVEAERKRVGKKLESQTSYTTENAKNGTEDDWKEVMQRRTSAMKEVREEAARPDWAQQYLDKRNLKR